MRLGPQEIVLIIAIIIAAAVITRIIRTRRGTARQKEESPVDIPVKTPERKTKSPRSFLRRTGIAFILAGIILFLAGISMFRWAFQSYIWSFIIIAIGFAIVFLSRKKG